VATTIIGANVAVYGFAAGQFGLLDSLIAAGLAEAGLVSVVPTSPTWAAGSAYAVGTGVQGSDGNYYLAVLASTGVNPVGGYGYWELIPAGPSVPAILAPGTCSSILAENLALEATIVMLTAELAAAVASGGGTYTANYGSTY
jgi:hypothetical protein